MSSESPDLSVLARSKLHLSVGGKDSLHRWVLLKNSILRSSSSQPTSPVVLNKTDVIPPDEGDTEDEEVCCEEADSFMFPDASKLNSCGGADVTASEAEWLDSLLETLGEEDEHFNDVHVAMLPADDDDDQPFSPLISPMSSSDDLINPQPAYYPTPIIVPYPVPYPPFHPPVIRSFELDSLDSPSYEDPLPYYYNDMDDVEDLAVPDAIEDTSDDESDVVSTPSLIRSSSNSSLVDPASIPLPVERRRPQLHIYIDTDDSFITHSSLTLSPFVKIVFPPIITMSIKSASHVSPLAMQCSLYWSFDPITVYNSALLLSLTPYVSIFFWESHNARGCSLYCILDGCRDFFEV